MLSYLSMAMMAFQLFTRPCPLLSHFSASAEGLWRKYYRKASADVQVRVTETVVEIPVKRTGIGTVVPIAANPANRHQARP
jgi:hypothetical protein